MIPITKVRPGGRTARVADRVAVAVRDTLEADGFDGLTLQGVAERAAVGRATLYRRWPTRAALVLHGLAWALSDAVPIIDHGSLRADLAATLRSIGGFLSSRLGQAVVAAALGSEEGQAIRRTFWEGRAPEISAIFDRAITRGELRFGFDHEAAFAMLSGSLYFRVIVAGELVDDDWIRRVLLLLLDGQSPTWGNS